MKITIEVDTDHEAFWESLEGGQFKVDNLMNEVKGMLERFYRNPSIGKNFKFETPIYHEEELQH